jgi:predicted acetyltransferase
MAISWLNVQFVTNLCYNANHMSVTSSSGVFLTKPTDVHRASFLAMVQAIQATDSDNPFARHMAENKLDLATLQTADGWQSYLHKLDQQAKQQTVTNGRVPKTTYWLIDPTIAETPVVVGRLNVRHFLTPRLRQSFGHLGYIIHHQYRGWGYGKKLLELARLVAKDHVTDLDQYGGQVLLACRAGNQVSLHLLQTAGARFERAVVLPSGERELLYWLPVAK